MPLFFFHLRKKAGVDRDEWGLECPDLDAAYLDACRAIPDMAAELFRKGQNPMACAFEITDMDGRLLLEVPFDELMRDKSRPVSRRQALAQVDRSYDLAESVRQQTDLLMSSVQTARDLVAEIRAGNRKA